MKIAAFDLSLTRPAACVDGQLHVCDVGKRRSHERLNHIVGWVTEHAAGADLVAIEGYSYGAKGRAFISLAELGGIVRQHLWTAGVIYIDIPPTCVKKYATGRGNANKDEVLTAAIRRGGDLYTGQTNDEADAWWIWALTSDLAGQPVVTVPDSHREALTKLELREAA